VVFVAREERADGRSIAVEDVRVSADGEVVVPARFDGGSVALDPGVHTLTFEHAGFDPVEQRVDVREGERGRQVDVVFRASVSRAASPSPARPAADVVPEPPEEPSRPARPAPALTYAFGALAITALAVGVSMEAIGLSDRGQLEGSCKPTRSCNESDVSAARTRVAVGDVSLGLSAIFLASTAYVYFTRDPAPSSTALRIEVGPVAGGVAAGLESRW
jgi:hypothetical protein